MQLIFRQGVLLIVCCFTFLFGFGQSTTVSVTVGPPRPLTQAHAHNDYEHERPLFDALRHGFTSIEVDVHLWEGQLVVSHDQPKDGQALRTLEELYLMPLERLVQSNRGRVYPGYEGVFYLMIDIKTDAEATYLALREVLQPYGAMLSRTDNGVYQRGAVTVFLSGNRPVEMVGQETSRWVQIDGRPADLGKGYAPEFMPVVSDRYGRHFSWRGEGEMPPEQVEKLRQMTAAVHREGKKLRLWASPENEHVWKTLLDNGVDLINTDRLKALRDFLAKY